MTGTPAIQTLRLTKDYGKGVGLHDLDLSIGSGEVFGFLGPNGAGKTTTIRLLLDLIRPTRGIARLFGEPASKTALRARVGFVPGELAFDPRMTGLEMLRFLGDLHPGGSRSSRRHEALCARLGLPDSDLHRPTREYSRGMRQKLGIVAAFQSDPELLVLDEPTEGLDPLVREGVLELIAEAGRSGRTVFLSSHVLSEVERVCTRVGILRGGRLVALQTLAEVQAASVRTMVVHFADAFSAGELIAAGAELVEAVGRRVVLHVRGDLDPLLAVLARHRVTHLAFPEPTLEDAFSAYYRDEARR